MTGFQTKNRVNNRHYSAYKNFQRDSQKNTLKNSQTMHFCETNTSFGLNMKFAKKCSSLKKEPQNVGIFEPRDIDDDSSRISSPNTSFYIQSAGAKSFYMNKEESKIKLIKMQSDSDENEITLPNINSKVTYNADDTPKKPATEAVSRNVSNTEQTREVRIEDNSSYMNKNSLARDLDSKIRYFYV